MSPFRQDSLFCFKYGMKLSLNIRYNHKIIIIMKNNITNENTYIPIVLDTYRPIRDTRQKTSLVQARNRISLFLYVPVGFATEKVRISVSSTKLINSVRKTSYFTKHLPFYIIDHSIAKYSLFSFLFTISCLTIEAF